MTARVQVLSRGGCHLCEDAIGVVAALCKELQESFEIVDVDGDTALKERHGDEVPVVLVDGAIVGFWRIQPEALRSALLH
jgi:coenzyme F420-reducing hydrogenase gamma subunit